MSSSAAANQLHSFPLMRKKVPAATPSKPTLRPTPQNTDGPTPGCCTLTSGDTTQMLSHVVWSVNSGQWLVSYLLKSFFEETLLTPDFGQWLVQSWVWNCAAVEVSLLSREVQSGRLSEGTICVGIGNIETCSFSHVLSVLGPVDVNGSRVETSHMTDQGVFPSELHLVFGEDHRTGGRICKGTAQVGIMFWW